MDSFRNLRSQFYRDTIKRLFVARLSLMIHPELENIVSPEHSVYDECVTLMMF